jgi:hypothetical protein
VPRAGRAWTLAGGERPIAVAVRLAAGTVAGVRAEQTTGRSAGCQDVPVAPSSKGTRGLSPQSCPNSTAGMAAGGCLAHLPNPDDGFGSA